MDEKGSLRFNSAVVSFVKEAQLREVEEYIYFLLRHKEILGINPERVLVYERLDGGLTLIQMHSWGGIFRKEIFKYKIHIRRYT